MSTLRPLPRRCLSQLELLKAGLHTSACTRPLLPRHMRGAIPHGLAIGNCGGVGLLGSLDRCCCRCLRGALSCQCNLRQGCSRAQGKDQESDECGLHGRNQTFGRKHGSTEAARPGWPLSRLPGSGTWQWNWCAAPGKMPRAASATATQALQTAAPLRTHRRRARLGPVERFRLNPYRLVVLGREGADLLAAGLCPHLCLLVEKQFECPSSNSHANHRCAHCFRQALPRNTSSSAK
jgi:hypothetical protein